MKRRFVIVHLYFRALDPLTVGANLAATGGPPAVGAPDAGIAASDGSTPSASGLIEADERANRISVARDDAGAPIIPATGLAGALAHLLLRADRATGVERRDVLFGTMTDDYRAATNGESGTSQTIVPSAIDIDDGIIISVDDAGSTPPERTSGDGVTGHGNAPASVGVISERTRTVVDRVTGAGAKGLLFTVEELDLAESERVFVRVEVALPDDLNHDEEDPRSEALACLVEAVQAHGIVVGGSSRSGYGRLEVDQSRTQIWEVDLTTPVALKAWLLAEAREHPWQDARDLTGARIEELAPVTGSTLGSVATQGIRFELDLVPVEPYLVTAPPDPTMPAGDNTTNAVRVGGAPGLRGTSLRGALRGRAERLARTSDPTKQGMWNVVHQAGTTGTDPAGDPVSEAFGHTRHAGMVSVANAVAVGSVEQSFTFVAIDRFTGGALAQHLFSVRANTRGSLTLSVDVHCHAGDGPAWRAAIGQVLLVLLDVATGDLPLGGLTRRGFGTFHGTALRSQWMGAPAVDDIDLPDDGWTHQPVEPWETPGRSGFLPIDGNTRRFLDSCVEEFWKVTDEIGAVAP